MRPDLASLRARGKKVILALAKGFRALDSYVTDPVCQSPLANGDLVIYSLLPRHAAVFGIAVALTLPTALAARALAAQVVASQAPAQQSLLPQNAAGSYLAARHAGAERDAAAAATYYLNVLKLDPRNPDLLSRTFLSVLTDGDVDGAGKLADRVLAADHTDRIARLVIGIRELKQKRYAQAQQDFVQSVRGPVTDL